ncbi:hypothetical protein MOTE_17800 [Moorella thermoacetica]|uniref:Uncharacterized protein n=1 Tax=Neomoorella thermoacetica TaxID=1525 RepID=A0A1J5NJT0_NEOTH|nr:hypothetical protein MOTE_17800 [Moorella thermoacetica]
MMSFKTRIRRLLGSCFYVLVIFILFSTVSSIRHGTRPDKAILDLLDNRYFWVYQILPLAVGLLVANIFMLVGQREGKQKPPLRRQNFSRLKWRLTVISLGVLVAVGWQLAGLWQKGFVPADWDSYLLLLVLAMPFIVITLMAWLQKPDPEEIEALETGDYTRLAQLMDERDRLARLQAGNAALRFTIVFILIAGSLFDILVTRRWPARSLLEIELMAGAWLYFYYKFKLEI